MPVSVSFCFKIILLQNCTKVNEIFLLFLFQAPNIPQQPQTSMPDASMMGNYCLQYSNMMLKYLFIIYKAL